MKRFIPIFISLIFCFTGCWNYTDLDSKNTSEETVLRIQIGETGRTILPIDSPISNMTNFTLYASGNLSSFTKSYNSYSELQSDSITLETGNWIFSLSAKYGNTSYSDSKSITIVQGVNTVSFQLALSGKGNGKGSFSLSLDFSEASNSGDVTKAIAKLQTINGSNVTGFSQKTLSVSNKTVTYSENSVPTGSYRILITLYSNELELMTWREIVVVSSDLSSAANRKIDNLNLYHINYVLNDDSNFPASFATATVETYTKNTESFALPNLNRQAYSFSGWYTDSEFKGDSISNFDTSVTKDVTLYAKWNSIEYSITYNLNGGSFESEYPVKYNTTENITLINPNRTGYIFDGWYKNEDFSETKTTEIKSGSYENITFYAKWKLIEYTITYNLNGGQFESGYPTKYTVESETFELINPSREHYVFAGWCKDEDCSKTPVIKIQKGSVGNVVLYAKWELYEYSITYYLNGGEFISDYAHGYNIADSVSLVIPNFEGYDFAGWYTNKSFEGDAISEIPSGSSGNKKFYAKWKLIDYTITYELNGGYFSSEYQSNYNVKTDIILEKPVRDGYLFEGWYKKSDFSGEKISEIKKGTINNVTLFAKWRYDSYSITYHLENGEFISQVETTYRETFDCSKIIPYSKTRVFNGWYFSQTYEGNPITELVGYDNQDVELYASWKMPSEGDIIIEDGWIVNEENYNPLTMKAVAVLFMNNTSYFGVGVYNSGLTKYWFCDSNTPLYLRNTYSSNIGVVVESTSYPGSNASYPLTVKNIKGDFDGSDNYQKIQNLIVENLSNPSIFAYMNNYGKYFRSELFNTGWYIPSGYELRLLYLRKDKINSILSSIGANILLDTYYWSSSEVSSIFGVETRETYEPSQYAAFALDFSTGNCGWGNLARKDNRYSVCCIRKFDF